MEIVLTSCLKFANLYEVGTGEGIVQRIEIGEARG